MFIYPMRHCMMTFYVKKVMNKEEGQLCLAPQPCELRSNCTAVSIYIVTTPAAELKGEIPSSKECSSARIILSSYCSVMKPYVAFGTGRLNILLCQKLAIEEYVQSSCAKCHIELHDRTET